LLLVAPSQRLIKPELLHLVPPELTKTMLATYPSLRNSVGLRGERQLVPAADATETVQFHFIDRYENEKPYAKPDQTTWKKRRFAGKSGA
jgi:hypothetical protein